MFRDIQKIPFSITMKLNKIKHIIFTNTGTFNLVQMTMMIPSPFSFIILLTVKDTKFHLVSFRCSNWREQVSSTVLAARVDIPRLFRCIQLAKCQTYARLSWTTYCMLLCLHGGLVIEITLNMWEVQVQILVALGRASGVKLVPLWQSKIGSSRKENSSSLDVAFMVSAVAVRCNWLYFPLTTDTVLRACPVNIFILQNPLHPHFVEMHCQDYHHFQLHNCCHLHQKPERLLRNENLCLQGSFVNTPLAQSWCSPARSALMLKVMERV